MDKEAAVRELIYTYGRMANIPEDELENYVEQLKSLDNDQIVRTVIIKLKDLYDHKKLTLDQISMHVDKIFVLSSKYNSISDLIKELDELQKKNLIHQQMSLEDNHKLVLECFDDFNSLIKDANLDCFYTGGLMAFFVTETPLNRYHGDLDLMINENDLDILKKIIDLHPDFKMVCKMNDKDDTGHEFIIEYKGTPMNVGLFLFKRDIDNSVTFTSYYYDQGVLMCKEKNITPKASELSFDQNVKFHNGIPYNSMSLEDIYLSKIGSRPKDKYDASLIEPLVDREKVNELDIEKGLTLIDRNEVTCGVFYDFYQEFNKNIKK